MAAGSGGKFRKAASGGLSWESTRKKVGNSGKAVQRGDGLGRESTDEKEVRENQRATFRLPVRKGLSPPQSEEKKMLLWSSATTDRRSA